MNKYIWFALIILLGANVGQFYYFNAKLDSKAALIKVEQTKVTNLTTERDALSKSVTFLEDLTKVQDADYAASLKRFEDYKKNIASINVPTPPSFKTIIKEVPADVVVVQANEVSNETLSNINARARDFSGLRNEN